MRHLDPQNIFMKPLETKTCPECGRQFIAHHLKVYDHSHCARAAARKRAAHRESAQAHTDARVLALPDERVLATLENPSEDALRSFGAVLAALPTRCVTLTGAVPQNGTRYGDTVVVHGTDGVVNLIFDKDEEDVMEMMRRGMKATILK